MEIAKGIVVTILICLFVSAIIQSMTQSMSEKLVKEQELNKILKGLYQNEQSKTDTLYRILIHIRNQLSLMNLKDCPDEEKINIPNEIIDWINELDGITKGMSK